jgi:hypothetical protein
MSDEDESRASAAQGGGLLHLRATNHVARRCHAARKGVIRRHPLRRPNLLCRRQEHLDRDADFPAKRGRREALKPLLGGVDGEQGQIGDNRRRGPARIVAAAPTLSRNGNERRE